MKKVLTILVVASLIFATTACSGRQSGARDEEAVLEAVLAEFSQLAKIPRQSHHEQAISDYLTSWAKDKGFDYVQDDLNNIIIEVPATAGYEDTPLNHSPRPYGYGLCGCRWS